MRVAGGIPEKDSFIGYVFRASAKITAGAFKLATDRHVGAIMGKAKYIGGITT